MNIGKHPPDEEASTRGGRRQRGSGLGLAVARGLVGAHGRRIWAENLPSGGAGFALAVPLGASGMPPAGDDTHAAELRP